MELFHNYVSSCYGGRASDIFIVRNSGFVGMIEPYREIMADRGFKIREDYIAYSTQLCIIYCMQLLPEDVSETSNIANVRIYVKQAIDGLKVLLLVKTEVPITCDC